MIGPDGKIDSDHADGEWARDTGLTTGLYSGGVSPARAITEQ